MEEPELEKSQIEKKVKIVNKCDLCKNVLMYLYDKSNKISENMKNKVNEYNRNIDMYKDEIKNLIKSLINK